MPHFRKFPEFRISENPSVPSRNPTNQEFCWMKWSEVITRKVQEILSGSCGIPGNNCAHANSLLVPWASFSYLKSRVSDKNGVSLQWYIVEMHHSGWKPSNKCGTVLILASVLDWGARLIHWSFMIQNKNMVNNNFVMRAWMAVNPLLPSPSHLPLPFLHLKHLSYLWHSFRAQGVRVFPWSYRSVEQETQL